MNGMDNIRFILVLSLLFVMMLLWQAWQQDYGTVRQALPAQSVDTKAETGNKPATEAGNKPAAEVPEVGAKDIVAKAESVTAPSEEHGKRIRVETDTFRLEIDPRGAGIKKLELIDYPVAVDKPDQPLVLMDDSPALVHILQGGLLSNQPAPTHEDVYQTDRESYRLGAGQDRLEVPFTWTSPQGIRVIKTYVFQRGSYLVDVQYRIENNGKQTWSGRAYAQLKRNDPGHSRVRGTYTYTGAVFSSPDNRYEKVKFDDMRKHKISRDVVNGWAAMIQHYFIAALVPASKTSSYHYYSNTLPDGNFAIGMLSPVKKIAPGETGKFEGKVYIGPKIQKVMSKVADGLDLTVDYGILWFIAKPLFRGLVEVHKLVGNWGWAIVIITVILRLMFYPLSAAGYRSMANMRRLQPRMAALKERFKDDKTRMNQAVMQMYKEEKINPLGGCLPIVIQIPVFLALYWVLLESVEMRQSGFIFWYHDLSTKDPYFLLPILNGITMLIQQKLNPAPVDPVQAKVMMVLPLVFTFMFAFFPSGLVLYWVVSNSLSILQQWRITKNLERAGLSHRKS
jgi:YidC/Oxa1 family membrane protein insertase